MANRTMTPEQAAASRKRRAEHLEAAVRALLGSQGWARWVRVRSRNGLARYSWFNQVQIAAERADASYVCGRGDWRRLGCDLADGQWRRPIWILAPFTGKQAETINDSLTESVHNTAALKDLNTTIDHAEVIVAGLNRGRTRLGG